MSSSLTNRILVLAAGVFALWIGTKYLLPLLSPFLFGGVLALLAEPAVSFFRRRRLKGSWPSGLGVTAVLLFLAVLLSGAGALLVRELLQLANTLPDLGKTARQGIHVLENWAVSLACQAPKGIRPALTRTVEGVFSDGGIFVEQIAENIPAAVGNILSGVPDSALRLGTGLLSAYMISARLPVLKARLREMLPPHWRERYLPALGRGKKAVIGWLRAQGILMAMIFGIVTAGFLLLQIPYGPVWAFLIAVLDAVPLLGTGLVLIPWAAVCVLTGQTARAIGLAGIFVCAAVARSTAEPKLLGRHLGLDPLITLMALYIGYRIFGFWGLLATPVLTAAVKSAWS